MKRNHLKKAILLGLIAASIHAPVWAKTLDEGIWANPNIQETVKGDNLEITSSGIGIGYNGTVTVTPDENGTGGKLTVDASGNAIEAGYQNDATVSILADNVSIESDDNGILTVAEKDRPGVAVNIGSIPTEENPNAEDRPVNSLTIEAKGQGIDNKNGTVNVYGSENSSIKIHSYGTEGNDKDQAAVHTGEGKYPQYGTLISKTYITGGYVELTADGGSGIMSSTETDTEKSETIIHANDRVVIKSDDSGKKTEAGAEIENAGINNMAGDTTVEAANGISITSSKSGILAQSGTVDVKSTAGSNIIRAFTAITPEGDSAAAEETAEEEAAETEKRDAVAVYAKDNAVINLTAGTDGVNYIATEIAKKDSTANERTIWAQRGGKINIKGQTFIIASNANTYTEDAIEGEEQVKGNAVGIAFHCRQ